MSVTTSDKRPESAPPPKLRGYLVQLLIIICINVPTVSFGLALGWVSLASGSQGAGGSEGALVGGAAGTFVAGLVGVPLAARAITHGRKPALIAVSAAFLVCWALKLCGGWCVVAARLCAGVAGAAVWLVAPLLAGELVCPALRGAAAAAPVLAHNLGFLLMYAAGDAGLDHRVVLWSCLALSALHCVGFPFAPESPAFLAAQGDYKGARRVLARLRGVHEQEPSLAAELGALPAPEPAGAAPCALLEDMLSSRARARALLIGMVCVLGQECCGVLTLLQFAERVFLEVPGGAGGGAARRALLLGAVQLLASALGLYLLERVGRRALVSWGAVCVALALGGGAAAAAAGAGWAAAGALAAAVGADAAALQPAPYALLADLFSYRWRGAAVALATAAASAGNAAETLAFPALVARAGLAPALALAAALTLLYAAFAFACVPETRGRDLRDVYEELAPSRPDPEAGARHTEPTDDRTIVHSAQTAGVACDMTPSGVADAADTDPTLAVATHSECSTL